MDDFYVAVDGEGNEYVFSSYPKPADSQFKFYRTDYSQGRSTGDLLQKGTIKCAIGKELLFDDGPVLVKRSVLRDAERIAING